MEVKVCVGRPVDPGLGSRVGNALRGTWSRGVSVCAKPRPDG